jgi:hypothetical protein
MLVKLTPRDKQRAKMNPSVREAHVCQVHDLHNEMLLLVMNANAFKKV